MSNILTDKLRKNPVIAGVKAVENFDEALNSSCDIIFLLCGNIFNLKDLVSQAKDKGKMIFIHVDLVEGFSKDSVALEYINREIRPDGIISTKNNQLKAARSLGMLTVQRVFIIDSLSIDTAIKTSKMISPDAIEIMPGIMPRITKTFSTSLDMPVIVGGLVRESEDIVNALSNGALGVSTSSNKLWGMKV